MYNTLRKQWYLPHILVPKHVYVCQWESYTDYTDRLAISNNCWNCVHYRKRLVLSQSVSWDRPWALKICNPAYCGDDRTIHWVQERYTSFEKNRTKRYERGAKGGRTAFLTLLSQIAESRFFPSASLHCVHFHAPMWGQRQNMIHRAVHKLNSISVRWPPCSELYQRERERLGRISQTLNLRV